MLETWNCSVICALNMEGNDLNAPIYSHLSPICCQVPRVIQVIDHKTVGDQISWYLDSFLLYIYLNFVGFLHNSSATGVFHGYGD